ncbi:serine hydrolase domain-containing protein [Pedobacter yulinensis]|nr:serine hydrolase domain-containing protein [Pedobacter yulinensis]
MLLPIALGSCKKDDNPYKNAKYDFSAVDQFVDENLGVYQNKVAILVSQNGQIIYHKEVNMGLNTPLPIASASKWLSGAVIMALADEQKLSLNDTVGKFLPDFSKYKKGHITIRQLFSHTSGFAGDGDGSDTTDKYEYRNDLTLARAVDSIAAYTPLVATPGAIFSYGSASMQVAGRIAEVVSGKPWGQLFNEKIAQPCQMRAEYFLRAQNPLIAGGVRTTARDYLNFLEMIAAGGSYGGRQVLSRSALSDMLKDQTNGATIVGTPYPNNPFSPYNNKDLRYGVGNWLDVVDPAGNVLESSSPGLLGAHPWQDSKNQVAGIVFTRTAPRISQATSLKIRQMIRDIMASTGK